MMKVPWRRSHATPAAAVPPPSVPADRRCYAVGDIHGRVDLLTQTLATVRADMAAQPVERAFLVFLGDLIDRGPASREVVEMLRVADWDWITPVFLQGNHEEAMIASYEGDVDALRSWVGFGGAETLESYGVPAVTLLKGAWHEYLEAMRAAVPADHIAFLRSFYDQFVLGDYLFVHAGIRPGVPLDQQKPRDLRWIRAEFLLSPAHHGKVVVHGHTIALEPQLLPNRIGIDTGAYDTGRLTTLRLQGTEQRILTEIAD